MTGSERKSFAFYWLTGQREVLDGKNPTDALNHAGYGGGALRALDFWSVAEKDEWQWNAAEHKWEPKPDSDFGKQIARMRERSAAAP